MGQTDTKQCLLDAAEKLFADEGFHNTSLRAITGSAGVNLASVNYHFGSKESLLEALLERRLLPLNKERRERIQSIREKAKNNGHCPDAMEALRAFIEPVLNLRKSCQGAENFITLVSRANAEPDGTVRKKFIELNKPLFALLFETLSEALPDIPKDVLFWRVHFSIGAMSHAMHMIGKSGEISGNISSNSDGDAITSMLLNFITAGVSAR